MLKRVHVFFLHQPSNRCQIVIGTYKTNVSSFLGIFSIIQSIYPSIRQPINNKLQRRHIDIEKWSSVRPWPNTFSNSSKIAEVAAIFRKKTMFVRSRSWRLRDNFLLGSA